MMDPTSHRLGLLCRVSPIHVVSSPSCGTCVPKNARFAGGSPTPSEVLSPSTSFQSCGAHDVGDIPLPSDQAAPSEFLTLPTRCSPQGLLGLFHPNPATGVPPSRPFSSYAAVRVFTRRCPRDVTRLSRDNLAHLKGFYTPQEAPLRI